MWYKIKANLFYSIPLSPYAKKLLEGKMLFQKITPCISFSAAPGESFKMEIRAHYCTFNYPPNEWHV